MSSYYSTRVLATRIASLTTRALTCPDIDVFSHRKMVHSYSSRGSQKYILETTEILKLNSFHEACIRLINKQTLLNELRDCQGSCREIPSAASREILYKNDGLKTVPPLRIVYWSKMRLIHCKFTVPGTVNRNRSPEITNCVES